MHDHLHLNLLALDTAMEACSVALLTQGQTDAHFELAPREHTQRILPLIDTLLRQRRLTLAELDAIVFCQGPGSFTGVRIGIGIAQGLAFGATRPLIGVSSLACLAQGAWRFHQANRVLTAIDARMGEIYWAEYQRDAAGHWHGRETEQVITPEQAQNRMEQLTGDWVTAGSGWQACPQLNQGCSLTLQAGEVLLPAAEDMLPLALQCWQQGQTVSPAEVDPVYLRNEVTWKKLPDR